MTDGYNHDVRNDDDDNDNDLKTSYDEAELNRMAQACIHVLEVKELLRGRDLGALLFSNVMSLLRRRLRQLVRCRLDAEEDVSRHGHLVDFYKGLGCSELGPNIASGKVRYLDNADGSATYRKVPMQCVLGRVKKKKWAREGKGVKIEQVFPSVKERINKNERATTTPDCILSDSIKVSEHYDSDDSDDTGNDEASELSKTGGAFLPVDLIESSGSRVHIPNLDAVNQQEDINGRKLTLLLVQDDNDGTVEIRTTLGQKLVMDPVDGEILVATVEKSSTSRKNLKKKRRDTTLEQSLSSSRESFELNSSFSNDVTSPPSFSIPEPLSKFHLIRVPDGCKFLDGKKINGETSTDIAAKCETDVTSKDPLSPSSFPSSSSSSTSSSTSHKQLWVLRTVNLGMFLTISPCNYSCSSSSNSGGDNITTQIISDKSPVPLSFLHCTKSLSFWQANMSSLTLTSTRDTPLRCLHYRNMWEIQCVEYVKDMKNQYYDCQPSSESYSKHNKDNIFDANGKQLLDEYPRYRWDHQHRPSLGFGLSMTIQHALNLVSNLSHWPYEALSSPSLSSRLLFPSTSNKCPSIRTFCFRTAEKARVDGHPDWFQLVAILHELGRVAKVLQDSLTSNNCGCGNCNDDKCEIEKNCVNSNKMTSVSGEYDWTIASRSRIVGCPPSTGTNFNEFHCLDPDRFSQTYQSSSTGMYTAKCGIMRNANLAWTGPEYMYHVLRRAHTNLPDVALAVLRLYPLGDWYMHGKYSELEDELDTNIREYVKEFDRFRRTVRDDVFSGINDKEDNDFSDSKCQKLWNDHYHMLSVKYGCDKEMVW